jgi:hypothetical protein
LIDSLHALQPTVSQLQTRTSTNNTTVFLPTATINVANGETVTCTFVNSPEPPPNTFLLDSNNKMIREPNTGVVSINKEADEIWTSDAGSVAHAGGGTAWTVLLVGDGEPTASLTINIQIWWQAGSCTVAGITAGNTFASATNLAMAPQAAGFGYSFTVPGSGVGTKVFGANDRLCLRVLNNGTNANPKDQDSNRHIVHQRRLRLHDHRRRLGRQLSN